MPDDRKKLLIVTTVAATIKAFLLPYADHFRRLGWRVDAMCRGATETPELAEHFEELHDIQWSRSPFSPRGLAEGKRVVLAVEDIRYDIVHVHTPVAAFITRLALRRKRDDRTAKPKIVYTAHGFHFFDGGSRRRNLAYRTLERMAGRWTDRLVVINREDYAAAKRYRIVPREHLSLMPGIGLDFTRYSRDAISREEILAVRTELGLKDDDVLYTMLAEFNPGKRHRDAIDALARTKDPRIHIAFAGDGPLRAKMQDLARSLSVHNRTHFLGFVKEPLALMAASRATLNSSEREGLSRSAMESACLGVPIIGSSARGVRDVIESQRGIVYPVGDVLALRDAMLRLAEEPYHAVKPDPDWRIEALIRRHEALYDDLLSEAERERAAYAADLADRAERARVEAERRAAEEAERAERARVAREQKAAAREEKERLRAERAAEKAMQREIEQKAKAARAEAKRAEKERAAEEKRKRKIERELAKVGTSPVQDDDDAGLFGSLDDIQMQAERGMWTPEQGDASGRLDTDEG